MSQYRTFESHFDITSWASPSGPEGRNMKEFDLVQSAVYNALGVGKKNAVSRKELVEKTGYSDRLIRRTIEILRRDRVIINLDTGYYIPYSNEQGRRETERWLAKQRSRTRAIKRAARGAERFVRDGEDMPGQMEMAGVWE